MKLELYGTKNWVDYHVGYNKHNDTDYAIGLGLYPDFGITLHIWKVCLDFTFKLKRNG